MLTSDEKTEIDAMTARNPAERRRSGRARSGAVYFIDRALGTFAQDMRPVVSSGLALLPAMIRTRYTAPAFLRASARSTGHCSSRHRAEQLLPVHPVGGTIAHLLGTCRMGNDPARSVVDRSHRAHDVPNLFLVDGISFVTVERLGV